MHDSCDARLNMQVRHQVRVESVNGGTKMASVGSIQRDEGAHRPRTIRSNILLLRP